MSALQPRPKLDAEPRLAGESSALIEWARRVAAAFNPIADFFAFLQPAYSATTSQLSIVSPTGNAALILDTGSPPGVASLNGFKLGLPRWSIQLGNGAAETGAGAGNDLAINRYSDAGAYVSSPLTIVRSTGLAQFGSGLGVTGNLTVSSGAMAATGSIQSGTVLITNPSSGMQFSPAYTAAAGSDWMCMVSYGDPNLGSFNYHQLYHSPGVWAGHRFVCQGTAVFEMRGSGTGQSTGGWVATSDRRVKTNLAPIVGALAKVQALTAYEFDRTNAKNMDGSMVHAVGLIAQDVEAVLPAAVTQDPATAENPDPIRSLSYDAVTSLLVEAVKELAAEVADLRSQLTTAAKAS